MEAPEKIYVHVKKDKVTNTWNSTWIGVHDVEYTRTDAFIEKACKWLENNASNYIIEHPFSSDVDFEEDKMIEDFKKYIEQ